MSSDGLDRAALLSVVDEARRAPSVHNIQPARWSLEGPLEIGLHADPARSLPIADPSGHDVRLSLGAACEGTAIALRRRGYAAAEVRIEPRPGPGPVARLSLARGAAPDGLANSVFLRAAYRGAFVTSDVAAIDRLARTLEPAGHVLIRERAAVQSLARLADQAGEEFLLDPAYWRETWHWLRFSTSDPCWARDGLNAESMALSRIERALGRVLMAPPTFQLMRRIGLAGVLVSERSKIESSAAMVLFTAPVNEDPFVTGRAFYRTWLEVTACGLALCPISALADSKRANEEIRRMAGLPPERRLVNVFRIGSAPAGFPTRLTPRLPAAELVRAS